MTSGILSDPKLLGEFQETIKKTIAEFNKDPKHPHFLQEFTLTDHEFPHPISLRLWSPLEQYCTKELKCTEHNLVLSANSWQSEVEKKSKYNPRILHCVFHNIILIQRSYTCSKSCNLKSASKSFMELLGDEISRSFSCKMYHRSGYTHKLVDFIFHMISEGNNFTQISQMLANFRLSELANLSEEDLSKSFLFSFPSSAKLEIVFLESFNQVEDLYKQPVSASTSSLIISTDHTFKVAKKVGCFRSMDGKFVSAEMKLFIVMNEERCVVGWKLTESVGHDEVVELLTEIKTKSQNIKYVALDNCCQDKSLYLEIFGNVEIKLDLFHAVKRITKVIPGKRYCREYQQFLSDFGLIFRSKGDIGSTREKVTPSKDVILKNLENFLIIQKPFLSSLSQSKSEEFNDELRKLKVHIEQGCLSGIQRGHGTEGNENLHRLLNRSLLRGVSYVGHELITAVLNVLFFHHNMKITGRKHKGNSKIIPVKIPKRFYQSQNMEIDMLDSVDSNENQETNEGVTSAALKILKRVSTTLEVLQQFASKSAHRSFKIEDLLKKIVTLEVELADDHQVILDYNLEAFNRILIPTERDGDCCFRSILECVYASKDTTIDAQLALLALNRNMEDDISTLRSHFVDRLLEDSSYQQFMISDDSEEVVRFRERGIFNSNCGDLVVKVLSDILKIPFTVIQSNTRFSVQTFVPPETITNVTLVIAYNIKELHYSSTVDNTAIEIPNDEREIGCFCKKGCIRSAARKGCPCADKSMPCSKFCKCRNCMNNKFAMEVQKSCRCITSQCRDQSARKTKCPCHKRSSGCTAQCLCKNCANDFGIRNNVEVKSRKKRSKNDYYTSYKRKRTEEFLSAEDQTIPKGSWALHETTTLYVCAELTLSDSGFMCLDHIYTIYNFIVKYQHLQSIIKIRSKSIGEIKAKLKYMSYL